MYLKYILILAKLMVFIYRKITIHWVSDVCDGGEIIAQYSTPLSESDTPEDIAAKVHALEMRHYPETIEKALASL